MRGVVEGSYRLVEGRGMTCVYEAEVAAEHL